MALLHSEDFRWEDRPTQAARIVIVSGDLRQKPTLLEYMEQYSFQTVWLLRFADLTRYLSGSSLVILDLACDHDDRLCLLSEIRSRSDAPIIVMVGPASSDIDRAVVLDAGADDCLTTPVAPCELVARIRAILRRREPALCSWTSPQ
jgi:two-component system, OmpR family, phosphate regulon response regulator OmpR